MFNDETYKKFDECIYNNYDFLRIINRIEFLDYNLLKAEKSFYLKLHEKCIKNNLFFTRETYNTKKIHTHNLFIYVNEKRVYPTESNNKDLKFINDCYKIEMANSVYTMIQKIIEHLKKSQIKKRNNFQKKFTIFEKKFNEFCSSLKNYYYGIYKNYLKNDNINNNSKDNSTNIEELENEFNSFILKLQKKIKKNNYQLRTIIGDLYYFSDLLVKSRSEQLIAFNITKALWKLETYPYINLRITTEELYTGFIDDKRINKFRSYFTGESAEFVLRIIGHSSASGYCEIIPPENTIITKVKCSEKKRNYNVMMEDFTKTKNKNSIPFLNDFNERLVIHRPRNLKESDDMNYNKNEIKNSSKELEQDPRIFFSLRPFKRLQLWVLASVILGIIYGLFLIYLLIHILINHIFLQDFITSNFLTSLIEFVKYQGTWIYGLIIGNQLWLQRPRFLWKKTTKLSIIIIIIGILLLIIIVYYNNFLQNFIIPLW